MVMLSEQAIAISLITIYKVQRRATRDYACNDGFQTGN